MNGLASLKRAGAEPANVRLGMLSTVNRRGLIEARPVALALDLALAFSAVNAAALLKRQVGWRHMIVKANSGYAR